jgi:hypothetical protein
VVISVEAARVLNAIIFDCMASKVGFDEHEIGSTDRHNLIDNNCTDDEHQFGMPGGSGDYEDARD